MSTKTGHIDLLAPPEPAAIDEAVSAFVEALRSRFGPSLSEVSLFGSRARGDFQPFSDVDIAVVFDSKDASTFSTTKALSDTAYDIFLTTGAEIQPWPFSKSEWHNPRLSQSPDLVRSARRDSRPIWRKT